ncbi:MAG: hypothetical protein RIQ31_612, partial [Actinomycetota bacterium]
MAKNQETVATEETVDIANRETEGLSQGQIVRRRFVRHKAAMISLFSLLAMVLFVFSASGLHFGTEKNPVSITGWAKYSITDLPELEYKSCPDGTTGCPTLDILPPFIDGTGVGIGDHPFGQDDLGRDYFS